MSIDPPSGCASCDEGSPINECPKSKRECGHHCNHSWSHDDCCWCGEHFGEEVTTPPPDPAVERANLRGLAEAARNGPLHGTLGTRQAFRDAANPRVVLGLLDEIDRLRKGGCARDQRTTQFCAEVVERDRVIRELRDILQAARVHVGTGEEQGYGGFHGGDPRDFFPDHECSTEEERANHANACAEFAAAEARGESPRLGDTHTILRDESGKMIAHIARNPYGLGSYVWRDPETCALAERIERALNGPLSILPTDRSEP